MWNFVTTRGANLGGRGAKFVGVDILVGGTRGQSHGESYKLWNSWGGLLYGGSGVSLQTDCERTAVQTYFPVVHEERLSTDNAYNLSEIKKILIYVYL